jgi:hypothetical protein
MCGWRAAVQIASASLPSFFYLRTKGFTTLRADDLHLMPKRIELIRSVKCSRAGFDDDCAGIDLRQDRGQARTSIPMSKRSQSAGRESPQ